MLPVVAVFIYLIHTLKTEFILPGGTLQLSVTLTSAPAVGYGVRICEINNARRLYHRRDAFYILLQPT
jgi:hypothetical protein